MNITRIIGIDPGKSGALCLLYLNGDMVLHKIAWNAVDVGRQLQHFNAGRSDTVVIVERVAMYRPDVKAIRKGGQDFSQFNKKKLWDHHERIMTCLALMDAQVCSLTPQSWQKGLRIYKKDEEYGDRKRRLATIAKQLYEFTGQPIRQWEADAILLAHWGRFYLAHDEDVIIDNIKDWEQ